MNSSGWYAAAAIAMLATIALIVVSIAVFNSLEKLESERQQSEARLRLHIARLPIAYIACSESFTVSEWSPAAERLFGWTEAEIVGLPASVLVPGHTLSSDLEAVWQRLLQGDFMAHSINENVTKDGRVIVCRWSNTPVRERDGRFKVISMAEDITEEQRSQTALRQSEERYRELVDSLPHYIYRVTNDDRYVTVNRAVCEFFRKPESEIIGKTPAELGIPPEIAKEWGDLKARTRATGTLQLQEQTLAPPGGGTRHIRTLTSPMRDENGEIFGVTGISMDITAEVTAEARKQDLLRALEQLDEVLFTTDRGGVITYANRAFEKVYGYSREEAVGNTPRILKSGDMPPESYRLIWSELLAGRSFHAEYRNRRKDGSLIDVVGSATPLFNTSGEITGFVAVQRDVSAEKRAAAERRELDSRLAQLAKIDALGTLAGGMAHDFNNILSIILTHATLLERKADPARLASAVATITQAVQRGSTITRQILTFARRAETKAEPLNTANLILEIASMIGETFPRTIRVTVDLDPDLPLVRADAGQLHQALLNLCVNSRDAMRNSGDLRLESRLVPAARMHVRFGDARSVDYLRISVADTGSGIDAETQRRIFEPFFTTKPHGQGTGLGLAVVQGVVDSHDGFIEVESEVGRGTTFHLYFPITTVANAEAHDRPPAARAGDQMLLIVDDEAAIVEGLAEGLRACGHTVLTASDGAEAIQVLRSASKPPDAVLMDLGMPKMAADELVSELRSIAPDVPLIAMTGYIDPKVHAQVMRMGIPQILQKPFDLDQLLSCLGDLGGKESHR